ncbi:hypothetical protein F3Y22_tig00111769pilonHSYRG00642 [Hibiscus syriacus]|uniref:Reverse transcriptase zinc-binding domain-containing protein n=1 Tax=Hibiscus syriacus TaxID=106335 RepID=A0A6A2YHI7_HIBSY|nr:hypothetical protein F3Y22_tig00111769pilonHSYRG00642 [Hibiscus syriacus]
MGNGNQIQFWKDPWLGNLGPLEKLRLDKPDGNMNAGTLASVIKQHGEWKWDKIHTCLPYPTMLHLAAVKPPLANRRDDKLGWIWGKRQHFSISRAYKHRMGMNGTNGSGKLYRTFRVYQEFTSFFG